MRNDLKIVNDSQFKKWIAEIKVRVKRSQLKAAVQVNSEMLHLYWDIGKDIVDKEAESEWGSGFYSSMSKALKAEFPNMSGFSVTNLKYMKRFYLFYSGEGQNRQQLVDDFEQWFLIPWGHQILLITKCQSIEEAMFYFS